MFLYQGFDLDSGQKTEKEFLDNYDASEFAKSNNSKFPNWKVLDLSDYSVIDSSDIHQNEMDGIVDDMFSDQDGEYDLD